MKSIAQVLQEKAAQAAQHEARQFKSPFLTVLDALRFELQWRARQAGH